jgi:mono/diheme cytochrome c family protein
MPDARVAMFRASIFVIALGAAGCAADQRTEAPPTGAVQQESLVEDGRDIAEAQCASCHAVGPYGESPNANAPAFRVVLSRYNADVLQEELIAGIQVAHPMPAFQFNPQGTDALIAYLQSIQQAPPAARE